MSHFFVGAIVPKGVAAPDRYIDDIMAPFDEGVEVEEYDERCWCVGHKVEMEAIAKEKEKFGDMSELRNDFWVYIKGHPEVDEDAEWKRRIKPRQEFREEFIANHPDKDKPDPDCPNCAGTGWYETTYNPESKWDWWSYGGRWNGSIKDEYNGDGDKGFNFDDEYRQMRNNFTTVGYILEDLDERLPFALVDENGWYERGKMGWFGITLDEKGDDEWKGLARRVLESYEKDDLVFGLDCHI